MQLQVLKVSWQLVISVIESTIIIHWKCNFIAKQQGSCVAGKKWELQNLMKKVCCAANWRKKVETFRHQSSPNSFARMSKVSFSWPHFEEMSCAMDMLWSIDRFGPEKRSPARFISCGIGNMSLSGAVDWKGRVGARLVTECFNFFPSVCRATHLFH